MQYTIDLRNTFYHKTREEMIEGNTSASNNSNGGEGRKVKALNVALLLTFAALLVFVSAAMICNIKGIQIQDSLINMFLGILGTEVATCGGIQIFKKKYKSADGSHQRTKAVENGAKSRPTSSI